MKRSSFGSLAVHSLGLFLALSSLATTALAAEPGAGPEGPEAAEVHRAKARILIEQKDWSTAAEEIRQSTKLDPSSAEGWLVLGTVTMRLERNVEALDAFKTYLTLDPPADKAAAVKRRILELELRLDKEKRAKAEADAAKAAAEQAATKKEAERYGPLGNGLFLAYSPLYKPKVSTSGDLGSSVSSSFDVGFRIHLVDFGLRYASGKVGRITAIDDKKVTSGPYLGGSHTLYELFGRIYFALNDVPLGKAGFQALIPLHLGLFVNNVKFNTTYWNAGLDAGTGLQLRFYTGTHVSFDLSGLYCFSLPINPIRNNDARFIYALNSSGAKIAGKIDGFDLRVGATILF